MSTKSVRFNDQAPQIRSYESTTRKRSGKSDETPAWGPGGPEYDPLLPYGPKVYLARKKKPDPWWVWYVEIGVVAFVLLAFVYLYFYIDHVHYRVTHAYAYLGSSHAQHSLAHQYLEGKIVGKSDKDAMYWFRQASKNGHPQAGYNLVAAHMQGYDTDIQEHEIEPLLHHAHKNGIRKASQALRDLYPHKY